jgi:putative endonuclease
MTGVVSYLAGRVAEDQVAADYARRGYRILSRRWRGRAGELDLVVEKNGTIIVIEVKKSRSFARAAERLSPRQQARIWDSAADYVGHMPLGQRTDVRVDVALLDCHGDLRVLENALCA